uniref:Uncharacterized LOC102075623 n=1 Tax=Oreochromis niloticus TaxID=8128 RepID=A0A669EE39_ORENI
MKTLNDYSSVEECYTINKMSGSGPFFLCFCLAYILCSSSAWEVKMPRNIKGLLGSCLVIPCSYDYYQYPPKRPDRVVWYQYVSRGYPIVSDNWNRNDVLDIFKGRTSVYTSSHHRTCSLLIKRVTLADHSQKLYPWVDPENVGWRTYPFYDTTVTVEVVGTADPPVIEIFGNKVVGQSVTVQCSVYHTCPTYPPSLRLNIPLRNERLTHSPLSDGRSKTMLTTTLFIEKEYQTVECYVQHRGGRSASASKTLTSQCSISGLTVSSASYEFLEGDQSTVTCTVSYTCYRNIPTLKWNYGNMPASSDTSKLSGGAQWRTVSTLTFTASANDNGRSLICYARFPGGQTKEASVTLRVKRNILNLGWSFTAPATITGLKGSCLIIPCKFLYKNSQPNNLKVIWYLYQRNKYPAVFNQGESVISKFHGRTSLTGSVTEKNCSLKIERLDMSHNRDRLYPWMDKNPIDSYRTIDHTFFDSSTELIVSEHAPEPQLSIIGILKVGEQGTVSCSVRHTCFSAPPTLTLKDLPGTNQNMDTLVSEGIWERKIIRTWTVKEEHESVSCAVNYPAGQSAEKSIPLTAECSISPLNISSTSDEFLEGYDSKVTCTALYTCRKNTPTLTWNYGSVAASANTEKVPGETQWRTVSMLSFKSSPSDNGRSVTCFAKFKGGQTQEVSISLRVKRNILNRGWSFNAPSTIIGLKGSCLIIPCKFSYKNSQPNDLQVMWYLYQINGFPAVFNQGGSVISKFDGRTSLIGSVVEQNCSLKIERLEMSHNHDRLYPWIDKNSITSYHTVGHSFYDGSTELSVSEHAPEPELNIIGTPRVGEQGTVSCSVRHACISAPPTVTLNGIPGKDQITDTLVSDGIWERTVERFWEVKEEHQSVTCTVSYSGGQKATKEIPLNVECPFQEITMNEPPGELTEGMAKNVTCSVIFKCRKNTPSVIWNYNNMQSSLNTKMTPNNTYTIVSNLTFIPSLSDDGKLLTCTAQFISGEFSTSATLTVKQYERDPFENYTASALPADVPLRFSALTRSCVVIPCSFQYKEDEPMTRGIWSKKKGDIIFHNGQSYKEHETHTFNNSCVFIIMKASPEKPVMTPVPEEVDAGSTITVSCSVTHTCSSHPPVFSWSVSHLTSEVSHIMMSRGTWQTTSTITFIVTEGDGVRNLTCNAIFWRNRQQAHTVSLNVKGSLTYRFKSAAPVAFPVSFVALIIITLAAVFAVFIWRKRKHTDESLKPPPRPEKRRSFWDRLSRRYPDDRDRPPRPEKRRSIWSRFSRKEEDRMAWQQERKPRQSFWSRFSRRQDRTANISVGYSKNSSNVTCGAESKPRCPSPKDNRRRPSPFNPEVSGIAVNDKIQINQI